MGGISPMITLYNEAQVREGKPRS